MLNQKCIDSGRTCYKVRIMCHELETVYLADLNAVEQGLKLSSVAKMQEQNPYRQPDLVPNPKQILKDLAKKHRGSYQDIAGSRSISPYLNIENIRSDSFKNLVLAIRNLAS